MHVEDRVRERIEELVAEDPVVPGADDEAHAGSAKSIAHLSIADLRVATEVRLREPNRGDPAAPRDLERGRVGPVGDDEGHLRRKARCGTGFEQRLEIGPRPRHQHPDRGTRTHRSTTRRGPDCATTSPMRQTGIPAALSIGGASAGTMTTIPTPMLNVRHISSRWIPPAFWSASKMGGMFHVERSRFAASPSGSTRGTLSMTPPPVMCAMAWMSVFVRSSRIAWRYARCGSRRRSTSGLSVPGRT